MRPARTDAATAARGVAPKLADLVEAALGRPLAVRLRAWDGSETGPADALTVVLTSRRALRRLAWDPNELGAARAYVAGELDVPGGPAELADGLSRLWRLLRGGGGDGNGHVRMPELTARDRLRLVMTAVRLGVLGPRPAPPPEEARLSGRLHTSGRDRAAVSHHYDLSNEFYELLLDPQLAYSSAYVTSPGQSLESAQEAKLELICRKLGLREGMHVLDIGCGWGSFILYAAEHYGVRATGVTLAAQQRDFVAKRIADRGLTGRVDVALRDYRELDASDGPGGAGYDAIASVEMGEHVGQDNYPTYAASLARLVRPRGRVLVQQMTRPRNAPGGGAFIERYVAPDMHMRPIGETLAMLEAGGLECRGMQSLREDYVFTAKAWASTLEQHWARFVGLVGERQARVWRLYLAGGALAFAQGRMSVHQVLLVRPDAQGNSGYRAGDSALTSCG